MRRTPDPERLDDDAPEADAEWFARAKPAAEVLPELFVDDATARWAAQTDTAPARSARKQRITVEVDADVVGIFRSTGRGWQARINNALREWLREHPSMT